MNTLQENLKNMAHCIYAMADSDEKQSLLAHLSDLSHTIKIVSDSFNSIASGVDAISYLDI